MSATSKAIHASPVLTAVVVVTLAASVGCATTRTPRRQLADKNISTKVANKFLRDPEIDRYRIDIDTINGIVTLRGHVDSDDEREEAERLARRITGVVRVENKLEIDRQRREARTAFEDAWIAVMVESKLARDPEVRSRNVDIDVKGGVVTLSGIVESTRAKQEAEELATTVDGVIKVVNELEVAG